MLECGEVARNSTIARESPGWSGMPFFSSSISSGCEYNYCKRVRFYLFCRLCSKFTICVFFFFMNRRKSCFMWVI